MANGGSNSRVAASHHRNARRGCQPRCYTRRTVDVVTFGETMVLFAAAEQGPLRFANTYTRHAAGTESNFAIGLARLGHQVGWFSRVGDDEFGQYIVNTGPGEGVDTSRVIVDPEAPTGAPFK